MEHPEAEIQVLASLRLAHRNGMPSDRKALEASGHRFWIFKENRSNGYRSLAVKRLIDETPEGYRLPARGQALARSFRRERPGLHCYYYQKLNWAAWSVAPVSWPTGGSWQVKGHLA